jgi:hypothetical protein
LNDQARARISPIVGAWDSHADNTLILKAVQGQRANLSQCPLFRDAAA